MGCGASAAAEQSKAEAPKDHAWTWRVFQVFGGSGAWLSEKLYVFITGDNEIKEHPIKELDVATGSITERGMFKVPLEGYMWPYMSTRAPECHATTMVFSPDGTKLAVEGSRQKLFIYSLPDGKQVMKDEGEKTNDYGMLPLWWDNDTVLAFHQWIAYAFKASTGEKLCRFELPKGALALTSFWEGMVALALEYVRRSNTTASVAMAVQRHEGNEHLVRTLQTLENESSMRYRHYETKPWLDEDGHVIWPLECVARLYVERSLFLQNRWNLIDLFIVLIGWAGMALTEMVNLNVLRIFRVIRLLRAGRLLISVPELYILLSGFELKGRRIDSNYTSPCPQCASGFATVYRASLTLFSQIVAGDAWGQISPPLAHAAPWTAPILFGIMMTISLGVMNLILAVIVEKAAEARQTDLDKKLMQKDQVRERNMVELALMCDRMDKDGSGALSLEEMLSGTWVEIGHGMS
eukprot:g16852.t1